MDNQSSSSYIDELELAVKPIKNDILKLFTRKDM